MNIHKQGIFLFLDDYRNPKDCFLYTKNTIYINEEWYIVRSYDEFVKFIEKNAFPDYISFDHDLADVHYKDSEEWDDYYNNQSLTKNEHDEKTGYDCALWLVDYCIDNNKKLPKYLCHSMNPVGKEKIISLLNMYEIHNENK